MKMNCFASSRRYLGLGGCLLGVAIAVAAASADAALVNQYTFNSDASDSVGNADGTLQGTASVSGGQLVLTGGGFGESYASLPAGVASTAASTGVSGEITTESWVTLNANSNWAVIFSFGNSGPDAMDNQGSDGVYWQLIPQNGGGGATDHFLRSTTHSADNMEIAVDDLVNSSALATGSLQQVVDVLDVANNSHTLYVNGVQVGSGGLQPGFDPNVYNPVGDSQNWLGRSQWGDPSLDGSFDEFRIYNTALSPQAVADSFAAGPTQGVPEPASLLLGLLGVGCLAVGVRRQQQK